MASYSIQMQDPDKNIVYPHALAKTTLLSDGGDVETQLADKANRADVPTNSELTEALATKGDLSALQAHTGNTGNPHNVTVTQIGAAAAIHSHSATVVEIPLASGISKRNNMVNCCCWKDDSGLVGFNLGASSSTSIAAGDIVATLPANYRPQRETWVCFVAVFMNNSSGVRAVGSIDISKNGQMIAHHAASGMTEVYVSGVFPVN